LKLRRKEGVEISSLFKRKKAKRGREGGEEGVWGNSGFFLSSVDPSLGEATPPLKLA